MVRQLMQIYPFNLARDIFGSEEEALKIYVPGVWDALETLPEREKDIIERRYNDKMTLNDIGKIHNVGRERVRQLEVSAIRKLRHTTRRSMILGVQKLEFERAMVEYHKLLDKYEVISCELRNIDSHREKIIDTMEIVIDELGLTTRSRRGLTRAGKMTLGDITKMTKTELWSTRNLGTKSVEEIIRKVEEYGLELRKEYE